MASIAPVSYGDASDEIREMYDRIKESLQVDDIPAPYTFYARVPAFLKDFFLNSKRFVFADGKLDAKTKITIAFAVASLQKSQGWIPFLATRLKGLGLDAQYLADTAAVAATCSMYNGFFKFRDISGSDVFGGMGVGLRAHTFSNTALDEKTVEIVNIAISDMNGCKPCTSGHVAKARELGFSDEQILEAVQCMSTMLAGIQFLNSVA